MYIVTVTYFRRLLCRFLTILQKLLFKKTFDILILFQELTFKLFLSVDFARSNKVISSYRLGKYPFANPPYTSGVKRQ